MTTFSQLGIAPQILNAIEKMGFKEPSSIQREAIPVALEGRDLIGLAETGSGKTATCAIPICQKVDPNKHTVQALVIVPTRELAIQYTAETQKIGREKKIKTLAVYGGESIGVQQKRLKAGAQVLIATPGRLMDFIRSKRVCLDQVETLVLDEADEMLSMGFYEDLEFIFKYLTHKHQTLLFSATMPPRITKIAKVHMKDPREIVLNTNQSGPDTLDHHFVYCPKVSERTEVLQKLLHEMEPKQCLIFCRSRAETEAVTKALRGRLEGVDFLHGGLAQRVRTRITNKFRKGAIRYLIVTDVASRGLDFSGVTHVFLFHFGDVVDLYMHRVGRTGRSGRKGMAVSLVTKRELSTLPKVLKRLDRKAEWIGSPPPSKPSFNKSSLDKPFLNKSGRRGTKKPKKLVKRYR